MSNMQTMKSCFAALAASVAFTTFADDVVVTTSTNINETINGTLIVEDGGNARVTSSVTVAQYNVKPGGTLTVGAGVKMEMAFGDPNSSNLGYLDTPGSGVLDSSQWARIVIEEDATIHDTENQNGAASRP